MHRISRSHLTRVPQLPSKFSHPEVHSHHTPRCLFHLLSRPFLTFRTPQASALAYRYRIRLPAFSLATPSDLSPDSCPSSLLFDDQTNMSDYVNPFADITLESLMQDEPPSIESMLQKEEDQNWDDLFDWDTYNFGAYVQQTTTESRQVKKKRHANRGATALRAGLCAPSILEIVSVTQSLI